MRIGYKFRLGFWPDWRLFPEEHPPRRDMDHILPTDAFMDEMICTSALGMQIALMDFLTGMYKRRKPVHDLWSLTIHVFKDNYNLGHVTTAAPFRSGNPIDSFDDFDQMAEEWWERATKFGSRVEIYDDRILGKVEY